MRNNNLLLVLSIVSLFFIAGCSEDDTSNGQTPDNPETIADYIANTAELSLLNEAILRVGLDTSLDGTDDYTLFAPNNAAFENFLTANEYESVSEIPIETLQQVLLNHLLAGNLQASNLQGFRNTFSEALDYPLSLFASNNNGITVNGNATVVNADITRSNGVIHEVNALIDVLTTSGMAQASSEFSRFEELLNAASQNGTDYIELLSFEKITYTVMVPSNQAFQDLFSLMGVSGFDEIPAKVLRDILDHHIIVGENLRSDGLEQNQAITTNTGEDLVVTIGESIGFVDATGNPAGVVTADVQTLNGVMHKIDRVLWSQSTLETLDPTITRWVQVDPDFSILETALQVTGLDAVLDDRNSEYTLLAPNNAAFSSFLQGEDVDDLPVDELTSLLLNHVIAGGVMSGDLSNGYVNTQATFNGGSDLLSMYVDTTNGVQFNGMSTVSQADVSLANGVIHVVDAVITHPTLVTFVTADPNLSTLTAALTRDDQPDYVSTLSTEMGSGDTPFTLWAPNNAAFDALLLELGLGDLSEIDGATLTATLNTHVVAQSNLRAEDLVSGPLATLGDEITVDADNATLTDGNGRTSNIQEVNIQASNGVLHFIDIVLLPQ
ncbi:fasciclin domain-containing protein [Aureisphaera galaxeae]|uniref:fasciclin domain-containing protein n=1 Tax=Aureisphaera galaxeae TaxID=1538023 RepID=UPI0023510613|nr:fasciclin domain-containing protein [Aureisphaera galaxeae]MDC8005516.1 fasciclin domain-containing protein [Aureisphaera galaxeae]